MPLRDHLNLSLMVFTAIPRPLTHSPTARRRVPDSPGTHTDACNFSIRPSRSMHFTLVVVALLSGWSGDPDRTGAVEGNACHAVRAGIHLRRPGGQLPVRAVRHPPDPSIQRLMWSSACMLGIIVALLVLLVMTRLSAIAAGCPRRPPPVQAHLKRPRCRACQRSFCIAITAGYFRAHASTCPKDDVCASNRAAHAASPRHARQALALPHLRRPFDGGEVQRALPQEPGEGPDRPLDRLRSADPDRLRRRSRAGRGEVGKVGVPVSHLGDMRTLLAGIPLDQMNTSMTINATAAWLLVALRRRRRRAGRAAQQAHRHDPERHHQGIPLARHLRVPARAVAAADQGHDRLLRRANCRSGTRPTSAPTTCRRPGATPVQELAYALATAHGRARRASRPRAR